MKKTLGIMLSSVFFLTPNAFAQGEKDTQKESKSFTVEGQVHVGRGAMKRIATLKSNCGKEQCPTYVLSGVMQKEFLRLHNHRLILSAIQTDKKEQNHQVIDVQDYTLSTKGDKRAEIGILKQQGDVYQLAQDNKRVINLNAGKGFMRHLKKRQGCKVWVVGTDKEEGKLKISKFGWLSCNKKESKKS